ncbi:MAG: hypothetical protein ACRD2W_15005 [Acidimicrobiales bacterium]
MKTVPLPRFRVIGVLSLLAVLATSVQGVPSSAQVPTPEPPAPGALAAAAPYIVLLAAPGDTGTFVPPRPQTAPRADAPSATLAITFAAGFPEAAKAPVQAAVNIWANDVAVPAWTTVRATYTSLGTGVLAGGSPSFVFRDFDNAPVAGTWYPGPLAEALSGQNLAEDDPDIVIEINTRSDWYYGTDGNVPSGRYDLMSVVLHEVAHGLGFLGTMNVSGNSGTWGIGSPPRPDIYDRFIEDAGGQKLPNYANNSTSLANALRSDQVFFDSPRTNQGQSDRIRLYAPNPWNPGSSISHFDEAAYPAGSSNSLATPYLNSAEAVHFIGPLALCVLEALGWATVENCAPPAPTQVSGATWPVNGVTAASGPAGTVISAYGMGLPSGRNFVLVTGLDGGAGRPCMWNTAPVNSTLRRTSSLGFIGPTTGAVNRQSGRWQVCFREETGAGTVTVGSPYTFSVP